MSNKIKIAIIQTSIYWEATEKNLNKYDLLIEQVEEKTRIILFPEMFNTGFSMSVSKISETMQGKTVSWLKTNAVKKNTAIVASLAIKEGKYFGALG